MEKKQKELEEKLAKKEAKKANIESSKKDGDPKSRPESEIKVSPEQPIEELVESKPQSAKKTPNNLIDFFSKQPERIQAQSNKVEPTILNLNGHSQWKKHSESKKSDSVQKKLFSKDNAKKEPTARKRSKQSHDSSKNLAGSLKTLCEKRPSTKKQKQENQSVVEKS